MDVAVVLGDSEAEGVDGVAGQDAGSAGKAAALPVGEAEFGLVEGVLAVDPAGESVADERGIERRPHHRVVAGIFAQHGGDEAGAVAVEQCSRSVHGVDDEQGHLGALLPFPFGDEGFDGDHIGHWLELDAVGPGDLHDVVEPGRGHELFAARHDVQARWRAQSAR